MFFWEMTSGNPSYSERCLVQHRIHALRQSTEASEEVRIFLRAGGLWTVSSVFELLEEHKKMWFLWETNPGKIILSAAGSTVDTCLRRAGSEFHTFSMCFRFDSDSCTDFRKVETSS